MQLSEIPGVNSKLFHAAGEFGFNKRVPSPPLLAVGPDDADTDPDDEEEPDDFDWNDPYSDDEKEQMGSSEFFFDND